MQKVSNNIYSVTADSLIRPDPHFYTTAVIFNLLCGPFKGRFGLTATVTKKTFRVPSKEKSKDLFTAISSRANVAAVDKIIYFHHICSITFFYPPFE